MHARPARPRLSTVAAAALASATLMLPMGPARAQDASFGCKVLLCALAANPSWQGIAYCVPIMQTLTALMGKKGFSWPPCPEAKTGAPGHEQHAACPAGSTAVDVATTGQTNTQSNGQSGPMCARPTPMNAAFAPADPASLDAESLQQRFELTPRPLRDKPYYFDMPQSDGQGTERMYFGLR
jgi:hypothetical protein